ncbi:hypothetical protein HMPREF1215_00680 [Coprococcus sp. HPP0074]|nr:hypothetical protein HMPREF1215_00680 [Coprococcus sp. HPP0074]DAU90903.1 MAG TPA: Portal protein [Caudoviricetes sp.]
MPEVNKEQSVEIQNESSPAANIYEFNSFVSPMDISSLFSCGIYDYFSKEEIDSILRDPIGNHDAAIRLSNFVYTKNGIVSNSVDYMTALPCLDRILISKNKRNTKTVQANKALMKSVLEKIDDRQFIRNALFTDMLDGIAFFYFETKKKNYDKTKFMTDYDVENIVEINEVGINASIISLPWKYTKIVGKKNGRYVLAFNLRYFDDYTGDKLERKLRKYPEEIVKAYNSRNTRTTGGDWVILDNDHTMCRKIKCKDSEPWGRSLIIAALADVLYKDYFTDTKRNVLDEINNKIIYQTFPEGKDKGSSSLTGKQQEQQHATVRQAVMNKNSRGGISFFSVAAGTKLDSIDVSTDIFDSKNESDLNDQISLDLGISSALIGAMTTGNYGASQSNLEMITAQLYVWVNEWQNELNYVINKNIIQNEKNRVEVYYFPTSFVNRKSFFDMMKGLYDVGGSLSFLIASTGVDPDAYFSVLDEEIDNKIYEKYLPHLNSNTISKNDDVAGRPKTETPTENTIKSRDNGGNNIPSPSDNK